MIVETKVPAASAVGSIAAVAAVVGTDFLYHQPIPQSAVEAMLLFIVVNGGTFIGGYLARHTHRPDLAATEVLPPDPGPTGPTGPEGGPPETMLTDAQAGQVQVAIDAAVAAIPAPAAAPTPVVVPVTVTAPPAPAWDAPAQPAPAPAPAPPVQVAVTPTQQAGATVAAPLT